MVAGTIGIVGRQAERTKWRLIALAMLVISLVIAMVFGFSVYTEPMTRLLAR